MTIEAQIQADIETVRAQVSNTQQLYREACTILFFRYGITPTANKLYHYVRKGSMSAPAEALTKFWGDLREKSRVRIEGPDLPDTLKSAAGELVANLWTQAQEAAQVELAAFRAEAQAIVREAQSARESTERELAAAISKQEQACQGMRAAMERSLQLERDLAAERASKEALAIQLEAAGRQQTMQEAALAEARQDFASELEKLRQALQRAEERYEASEKRALLEIDRERTVAAKLQKDLMQNRQYQQAVENRHHTELAQLQNTLGEARQQLGAAEGVLQEMRTTNQRLGEQLQALNTILAERDTQKALLQRELEIYHDKTAALMAELQRRSTSEPADSRRSKLRRSRKILVD